MSRPPDAHNVATAESAIPSSAASTSERTNQWIGLGEGLLAVFFFSLTLPMSRFTVRQIDPMIVGMSRSVIAGVIALLALWLTGQRWPTRREWIGLAAIAPGIMYIFPVLVAWAMRDVPASHGAIVIGLLPLSTAAFAALLGLERPPLLFWIAAFFGSATVVTYALVKSGGHLRPADLALLVAVVASGLAYAAGGHMARTLGGWQVISWTSAINLPFTSIILAVLFTKFGPTTPPSFATIAVLLFMSIFPQYVAFFSWYNGMARIGVNRISQLQLLQPFLTVAISAAFLGETITRGAILALLFVVSSIVVARKAAHIDEGPPD